MAPYVAHPAEAHTAHIGRPEIDIWDIQILERHALQICDAGDVVEALDELGI